MGRRITSYNVCYTKLLRFAGDYKSHFAVQPIKTVSTVGAGDNFNAGILYSVINQGLFVGTQDITHAQWAAMVATAEQFSANVCGSYDNYIDHTFAEKYTRNNFV